MLKKLSFTLLIFGLLLLSGCEIPLFTKYRVKRYLMEVEPTFDKVKEQSRKSEEILGNENITPAQAKEEIDKVVAELEESQKKINSLKAPTEARTLESNLKKYFPDSITLAKNIQILLDFMELAQETVDSLKTASAKLPTDFNKKTLAKIETDLKGLASEQTKALNQLKNQNVRSEFLGTKKAMVDMGQAYLDVLNNFIKGVETQNTAYFNTASFENKFDKAADKFSEELQKVIEELNLEKGSEELQKLEDNIEKNMVDLKAKYNI